MRTQALSREGRGRAVSHTLRTQARKAVAHTSELLRTQASKLDLMTFNRKGRYSASGASNYVIRTGVGVGGGAA